MSAERTAATSLFMFQSAAGESFQPAPAICRSRSRSSGVGSPPNATAPDAAPRVSPLTDAERQALPCLAALDAASCLVYGPDHGEHDVTARGLRTPARLERGAWGMLV